MNILVLEPFYGGSHRSFLEGLNKHSCHHYTFLTLPDNKWKWHMRSAPVFFSLELEKLEHDFDLIFCSDFLDLASFKGLATKKIRDLPVVLYMHENQITYPVQKEHQRDYHFGMTNIISVMAADYVWWNSQFHRDDFVAGARKYLKKMPGSNKEEWLRNFEKGVVMPLGLALPERRKTQLDGCLKILWNHRWEFDKNPEPFFRNLFELSDRGMEFDLIVAGEQFKKSPAIFDEIQEKLGSKVRHFGFAESKEDYCSLLRSCDIVASSAIHEFFGISMIEAAHSGCVPFVPNRLSYPEIFSEDGCRVLYDSDSQMYDLLATFLKSPSDFRSQYHAPDMSGYGWDIRSKDFDLAFDAAVNHGSTTQ